MCVKLSGTDISLLIDSANGSSYRLLIMNYPQLISSLYITRKNTTVIVPPSLIAESQFSTRAYDTSTPLLHTFGSYEWDPRTFNVTEEDHAKLIQSFKEINRKSLSWQQEEREWRAMPYSASTFLDKYFYRLIVTPDFEFVRRYAYQLVKIQNNDTVFHRYYKTTPAFIIDTLEKSDFEWNVENFVTSFGQPSDLEGNERGCLVVLNSHLLSEARRQFVVSRCAALKVKLAMVVDMYNPEDKIVKIVSTHHGSRFVEVYNSQKAFFVDGY